MDVKSIVQILRKHGSTDVPRAKDTFPSPIDLLSMVSHHFLANDFLVVLIVHLNVSIGNYVLHDLVSIAVKNHKCMLLVVAHFGQPEM
jgi:hypothetical protein